MDVEYSLTEADWVAFADYHYRRSPTVQRQRRGLQYGFGFGLLGLGVLLALANKSVAAGWYGFLIGGACLAFMPWWVRRSYRKQMARMMREGRNDSLLGPQQLQLQTDGLLWRSPGSEGRLEWSAIERVESSDQHTFIYLGALMAVVIPRAGVRRGDYDAFVRALGDRVGRAAA